MKVLKDNKDFFSAAARLASMSGLTIFVSFIGSVLLTRAVGPEGRGLITWFISSASIAAALINFGLEPINRKYSSAFPEISNSLMGLSQKITLIGFLLILPIYFFYAASQQYGKENLIIVIIVMPLIYLMASIPVKGGVLLGLHQVKEYTTANLLLKLTNTIIIISLYVIDCLNPFTAILGLFLANFSSYTYVLRSFKRVKDKNNEKWNSKIVGIVPIAMYNYINHLVGILKMSIVPIFLVQSSSLKQGGYYSACYILIEAMVKVIGMVSHYVLPKLSTMTNRRNDAIDFSKLIILLLLSFSSLIAVVWYFLAPYFIPFFFGDSFDEAVDVFHILLAAMVCMVGSNVVHNVNISHLNGYVITIPSLCGLACLLAACFGLIPSFAAEGGAYSLLCGYFVSFSVGVIIFFFTSK